MPSYQLAAFDFDGTLADTLPWLFGALNELADRHRFRKIGGDDVERLRHQTSREVMRSLGISRWRLPFLARDLSRLSAEAAAAGRFTLFPGVANLLADLAARGIGIAIVSSNQETTIRHVLGPSAAHISHFACSAALFGKARHFRQILRRTGLSPQAVLGIGDEVRDIEAATAAGITTAAVTWGYAHESTLRAAGPAVLVRSVEELWRVLLD